MPPGAGRIDRSATGSNGPAVVQDEQLPSDKLQAQVMAPLDPLPRKQV